jgi:hypothetical protein
VFGKLLAMEPATYHLSVLRPPPEEEWNRLQAELDRHGPPMIAMAREDGSVTFTAETWEPILKARVAEAVEAVWGHGEARRTFEPAGYVLS